MHIKTINIDMDGVLYDFAGAVAKLDGFAYQGRWMEHIYINKKMNHVDYITDRFDSAVEEGLFTIGRMCCDAELLLDHISYLKDKYKLTINLLGALPKNHTNTDKIQSDKIEWLKRNNLDTYFDNLIFVNGSSSKLVYGSKTSVLIDDFEKTKTQFNKIGVPFILHRNFESTFNELQDFNLI